jgi:16S rRNA processing protein RimM
MTSDDTTLTVATSKWHSGRFVVHFEGIEDRTAAESLRGQTLTIDVDPTELPEDPDEFYDHQLVGLNVKLEDGSLVGVVGEVIHLPSQDLLSVKREGDTEVLIPFVLEFVPKIDLDTKTVTITPPPGLLNELEAIVVRDEEV